jgi:hypothetical protein
MKPFGHSSSRFILDPASAAGHHEDPNCEPSRADCEDVEFDANRMLCLIADDRPADLPRILREIPDGLFREITLIDNNCSDEILADAQRLGLKIEVLPRNRGRGSLLKHCFDLARLQGVSAFVAFDAGQPRDLRSLVSILNLLDQESWDLIIGARAEKLKATRPPGMSRIDFYTSRLRRFLGPLFLGRHFLDSGSDFVACNSRLLWATRYAELSDGDVFDWQFMNRILASGYRVGEIPIPVTRFHSATRSGGLRGVLSLIHTMGIAVDHQFGRWIGKDRVFFRNKKKFSPLGSNKLFDTK